MIAYALTRPEQVLVPTVIGKDQAEAQAILEDAGFEVAVKADAETTRPRERCWSRTHRRAREVDEGSTVTITVSRASARSWCRT